MVIQDFRDIEHFTPDEFDHLGGYERVDVGVVRVADAIRSIWRRPLIIMSAFREGDSGQHGKGYALDLATTHPDRSHYPALVMECLRVRIGGFGVYDDTHIHIDTRTGAIGARWIVLEKEEVAWTWENLNACFETYTGR